MDEIKAILDQLHYEMFLAEQTMKMSLKQLDNKSKLVTEASDMIILNEAVIDVIKKYVAKVTDSMQKAWNNFTRNIDYKTIKFVIDNNKKRLESDFKMKLPDDFDYPKINVWTDINKDCTLGENKLNSSNYAQMSQFLDDTDKFLQQYYPNYIEKDNGRRMRMSDVFERRCFSKASEQDIVDSKLIAEFVNFLNDYKTQVEAIQEDINNINDVNKNIDELVRQIAGNNEATTTTPNTAPPTQKEVTNNSAVEFVGKYFLEADGNTPKKEDTSKFRNADANAQDSANNNKDRQNIINYYKAMTEILSAKMRTCNKVKSSSFRIVSNFVRLQGGLFKLPENK